MSIKGKLRGVLKAAKKLEKASTPEAEAKVINKVTKKAMRLAKKAGITADDSGMPSMQELNPRKAQRLEKRLEKASKRAARKAERMERRY